jgi:hypothetical protein
MNPDYRHADLATDAKLGRVTRPLTIFRTGPSEARSEKPFNLWAPARS